VIAACLRAIRAHLPLCAADSVRAACADMAGVPLAPPLDRSPIAAIAAIEAAEFVERDAAHDVERFGVLVMALESAISRDRSALAAVEAIEARPRPHGRTHGTEWAYEQLFLDTDRLRQCCDLLRALAPHEPAIRALVASAHPVPGA